MHRTDWNRWEAHRSNSRRQCGATTRNTVGSCASCKYKSTEHAPGQSGSIVIVTVRTWQLNRLNYAEFARISEEEYWPLFDKHGGRALGIWGVRVGAAERLMV